MKNRPSRPRIASPGESPFSRRRWLSDCGLGLGGLAFWSLLAKDGFAGTPVVGEASDPPPHLPAKARRVVQIVCSGGVSQVDSFDHKPDLEKFHGRPLPSEEKPDVFFGKVGLLHRSFWKFQQRGESGLWISDLFPHLAEIADELTVVRSMKAETSNHTPAAFQTQTGFRLNGFPTMGAWLSYGLGAETDDLPAFVVLPDPRGYPAGGSINWSNGFLPARHQGVPLQSRGPAINDLRPAQPIAEETDADGRELLAALNARHLADHGASDALLARIKSYELAAKMQLAVPEATALDRETKETHALYGVDAEETADFGRNCLLARRLLERGVRFVQIFAGGAFGSPRINWDAHEDVPQLHGQEAKRVDLPLAGLIRDLKSRGMLDDTLVLFTTEFGRTPFTQSDAGVLGKGRDHNPDGFSLWMAGGGFKPGVAFGQTDPLGGRAVEDVVTWPDLHATILRLLGIDHERLTFYHNGIQRRLTNVHGHAVEGILS